MTDKTTDITNVNDLPKGLIDLLEGLDSLIEKAVSEDAKDPDQIGGIRFVKMFHDVFTSMLLCTVVSHNRAREHDTIQDRVISDIASFVAEQTYYVVQKPCQESVDTALFNVMLYTRATVEDALGVKRHDGTAKGEECHLL